jgi:hypothetical protein
VRPRGLIATIALVLLVAHPVQAGAPQTSLRPIARPDSISGARSDGAVFLDSTKGVVRSLRPLARPDSLRAAAVPAPRKARPTQPVKVSNARAGAICGNPAIRGVRLAPIPARLPGCGVKNPVSVVSVSGVALSQAATMNCPTAKALNNWVRNGVAPTVGRLGGGVASLQVLAGYSCRTRNSKPGAKISEHGKGRAIDIGAINLKNGLSLDVLTGWNDRVQGKLLRRLHRVACGPFGTVLGPDSDRYHRNHFHLDTASYRGGAYCR